MSKKLDLTAPYGTVIPPQDGVYYEQNHCGYDHNHRLVRTADGRMVDVAEDEPVEDPAPGAEGDPKPDPDNQPEPASTPGPDSPSPEQPAPVVDETAAPDAEQDPNALVDNNPELGPIDPDAPWPEFRQTIKARFGVWIGKKEEGLKILADAGMLP